MKYEYRDVTEWKKCGIPLSTSSNEASKLFDASLNQFLGWYDDQSVGGLENTLKKTIEADPNFALGHCLALGIELYGTDQTTLHNPKFKERIEFCTSLPTTQKLSKWETKHVEAISHLAKKDFYSASQCYEDILCECPHDIFALKMAQDAYFFLGALPQLKDSVARVAPIWRSKNIPLKSYVHGMYAFGLEENHWYRKAEEEARQGLKLNPNDAWATHALTHVFEMEGKADDGIQFLTNTLNDWTQASYLATHNFWHLGLCYIEKGDYDTAYQILETEIMKRTENSVSMFNVVDAASLLYRLELTDTVKRDNKDYWDKLLALCRPHLKDHITAFNDCHFLMTILGKKNYEAANELLDSLSDSEDTIIGKNVVRPLLNAMIEFEREQYAKTVETLKPIRYKIVEIGGSNAQRDLFTQLLIVAAIKSPVECHRNLAHQLLNERKEWKDSGIATRLISQIS